MSYQKHNRSSVLIPAGWNRAQLKHKLGSSTLDADSRAVLFQVLDQADSFTLTVTFLTQRLGWTSHRRWPKARDKLLEVKLLTAHRVILADRSTQHHLDFDFSPLAEGNLDQKLSTEKEVLGGSRARACDPPTVGRSSDPPTAGGSKPDLVHLNKQQPPAVVVFSHDVEAKINEFPTGAKKLRDLLGQADGDQQAVWLREVTRQQDHADNAPALAVHLAKLAARRELTEPRALTEPNAGGRAAHCDPAIECARIVQATPALLGRTIAAKKSNLVIGPSGVLKDPSGSNVPVAAALSILQQLTRGELHLVA